MRHRGAATPERMHSSALLNCRWGNCAPSMSRAAIVVVEQIASWSAISRSEASAGLVIRAVPFVGFSMCSPEQGGNGPPLSTSPERSRLKSPSRAIRAGNFSVNSVCEGCGRKLSKTSARHWRTPENARGRLKNKRLSASQIAKKRGVEPSQRKTRSRCPEASAEPKLNLENLHLHDHETSKPRHRSGQPPPRKSPTKPNGSRNSKRNSSKRRAGGKRTHADRWRRPSLDRRR